MKKFEVGKIYCSRNPYSGNMDIREKILIKKVTENSISYVHIAKDGREYTLNDGGRKVDVARIKRWDNETERVHLNIGIIGQSYLAKYELNEEQGKEVK